MSQPSRIAITILIISFVASLSAVSLAQEPAPQAERFTGTVMVLNAPATGALYMKITIERWTTDEERKKLAEVLKSGGPDAFADAMEKMEPAGYIQIDNNLRWPIRSAASWKTEKGRMVRFATDRPINIAETQYSTRSRDYPIGVIQLLLPPEGKGEGALLAATQVQFDAEGRLEVKSLPTNMGPQKVINVQSEIVPPKKSKKK